MQGKVTMITAVGTRGDAKGKTFRAVEGPDGFRLQCAVTARATGTEVKSPRNKVLVKSLDEAARLVETGNYHIWLYNHEVDQLNLRMPSEVTVSRI